MLLDDLPSPIVFAHRGDSAHAPENTLAAFEQAARKGADAIELDAKLSADGVVVVIHDPTVDRTTDGRGKISRLPLAALREFDAGNGEKIPTLEEVFEAVGNRLLINVELTNYKTPKDSLVEKVAALVKRHHLEERVLFSSFLPRNLKEAAARLPQTPRGLLALPGLLGAWSRSFGFSFGEYQALHPHLRDATLVQIARVLQLGRRVHVWTVNDAEDIRRLHTWGVDGIFTDDPLLALRALGRAS